MNISKFMLFLLCFLLVFNFCLKPYTVEAVVPTVIGGKLLTFLLAMAAAGVTLTVAGKSDSQLAAEANKLMQEFENVNGQIDFWQDALKNYLKDKGYQGFNTFTSLLDNIKVWLQNFNVIEGVNFVTSGLVTVNGKSLEVYTLNNYSVHMKYDGSEKQLSAYPGRDILGISYTGDFFYQEANKTLYLVYTVATVIIHNGVRDDCSLPVPIPDPSGGYVPVVDDPISFDVYETAYPLTGIPPNYYHKPNVFPPPVPTTTWDLTTGRNVTTWPGTAEDFADDFGDTVTWDDYRDVVTGVPSIPYSLDEKVPGVLTIDYDYDYEDEGAGAIPIPYPDTYEGDIPSEGLLQGITNWITSLINTILGIPAKLIELLKQLLITLFVPDGDFMQNKMNDVNLKIGSKIGDDDYMNFLDSLKSLEGEPIPDGYIGNNKVFDASYINNLADTLKLWQRWFWYILIVLWYMNNVYKMIRGSDAVRGMEYDAGRGSSGGGKN